jgi:hypothetical protein
MLMLSPYSRKAVDVPDGLVDRFREAGFKEQEPEAVEPDEGSAPRTRRARKPRS